MVGVNCFLIAVVLWLGTSVAEGGNCNCDCDGKYGVCEDVRKLRTEVDVNVDKLRDWNQYLPSVRRYHRDWEREARWIQHFEEELNATADSHRQLEESVTEVVRNVQKNVEQLQTVQAELLDTMKNMAVSLEAFRRDVDDREVIMQNDIGQLKQELSRIQTLCSPPCENGGQCVKNVCNCPPSFTGDRCQQAVCSPPCKNGGECMKENVCNCTTFFTGDRCQDVKCSAPCENGGQCMANNTCQCTISFAGDRCQQAVCSPPCENGGECMKNNICSCPSSFTGDRCQDTACIPPCANGGQCMENKVCNCTPLFTGDICQDAACSPRCKNGGQCLRNNVCKCATSFYGYRCEGGPKCGVDFDSGVSNGGGNTSSVLVWPWMAAVYRNDTNGYRYACGGSVIHRHFVLTSAGCVNGYGSYPLSVKLGLSDLKNGTHLQEHRVQSTHLHPQYKTGTGYTNLDYNVGLLELEEPIPFGPFVRPVCLPPREIPQGEPFYKPQSTAKVVRPDDYLRSPQTSSPTVSNLTILPQEECRRIMKEKNAEKYFPSPDLSFCGERSSSTCSRNGSPVMESRVEGGGTRTWTQVGFRSWCHDKYIFSPRLDHLRAWVDDTIAASSKF